MITYKHVNNNTVLKHFLFLTLARKLQNTHFSVSDYNYPFVNKNAKETLAELNFLLHPKLILFLLEQNYLTIHI